jgi:hypothetical protein
MPPRYRPTKNLSPVDRQRIMRILVTPLMLRSFLPSFAIWIAFLYAEIGLTKLVFPNVNINGWPFILVAYPVSCLVFAGSMAVTHFMLIRWLLQYRTARRGRAVALRDILRPTDGQPSRLRRWRLTAYGVRPEDLALAASLWRSGAA